MAHVESRPSPSDAIATELEAYNRAFCELELPWQWDVKTYRELLDVAGDKDCVSLYIERKQPHLLRAYDKGFLRDLVLGVRERFRHELHRAA